MQQHTPVAGVLGLITLAFTLSGCPQRATPPAPAPTPSAASPPATAKDPAQPGLRLPANVRPVRYALDISLDPGTERFTGVVDIDIQVTAPTPVIWLNARDIEVQSADLTTADADSQVTVARVEPRDNRLIALRLPAPAFPGPAHLRLRYTGRVSGTEHRGLFHQEDSGSTYLFTHFEPTDARRVLPCFDEPGFKVPLRLTLRLPKDPTLVPLGNAPVAGEEVVEDRRVVRFAETRPLPTYLYAFAVGPFDLVEVGRVGRANTPVRIATPRGRAKEARYAAQVAAPLFRGLEDYFAIPYPFGKLDVVAVPHLFGAMENPGLITFAQPLLLARPQSETLAFQRQLSEILAHEIAHMWFGDLVTLGFWDETWLNESFASWISSKIVDAWHPAWGEHLAQGLRGLYAMREDSLVNARRIRQPITSEDDIHNAFDAITYQKGEAVLNMFEAWIGPEPFRRGVQSYLRQHSFGNATAADFLGALGTAAEREVGPVFGSFLDQAGVPLLTMDLRCSGDGPATVQVRQRRYLPLGSAGSPGGSDVSGSGASGAAAHGDGAAAQADAGNGPTAGRWRVPVCVRAGGPGQAAQDRCTLMEGEESTVTLPACPTWVMGNAGSGYYRVEYSGDLLGHLLERGWGQLSVAERVSALGDIEGMLRTGSLSAAEALRRLPALIADAPREVVLASMPIVRGLQPLVPDEQLPAYRAMVRGLYGERARGLGLVQRPGESEDARLLRRLLFDVVANEGDDPVLGAEAGRLARRWLVDRAALPPELAQTVLRAAARHGDAALYDQLLAAAKKTGDPNERNWLLQALGHFQDERLLRLALGLTLGGDFDARESMDVLFGVMSERATREQGYRFLKENFTALSRRLPQDYAPFLLALPANAFCDAAHRADVAAFAGPRAAGLPGGPRVVRKALERLDLCLAYSRAQQPSLIMALRAVQ